MDYDKEILKDILKYKKGGDILDLGCGKAGLSIELTKHGFTATCIDISPIPIPSNKIKFIQADISTLKINQKYDVVLLLGVFHLLKNPLALLEKITNKTRKNGLNVVDSIPSSKVEQVKEIYKNWKCLESENYKEDFSKELMNYFVFQSAHRSVAEPGPFSPPSKRSSNLQRKP